MRVGSLVLDCYWDQMKEGLESQRNKFGIEPGGHGLMSKKVCGITKGRNWRREEPKLRGQQTLKTAENNCESPTADHPVVSLVFTRERIQHQNQQSG